MKKYTDLMVDIETLGTSPGSVVLSIAAVEFDLDTGYTGKIFHSKISLADSLKANLKIDANTLKWWMEQDEDLRNTTFFDKKAELLPTVLSKFNVFFSPGMNVWGNSARFDLGLLEAIYNKVGLKVPWSPWKERCVRTLSELNPSIKKSLPFEGKKHDPVDDCLHQIKYCHLTYKSLNIK